MKFKLTIYILIIFVALSGFMLFYYMFSLRPKIQKVKVFEEQERVLLARKLDLMQSRLAYVEISGMEVSNKDFFEVFSYDFSILENHIENSNEWIKSEEAESIEEELYNKDINCNGNLSEIFSKLEITYNYLWNLLGYDPVKDLSGDYANGDFDVLLGRILQIEEGVEKYAKDERLKTEVIAVIETLTDIKNSLNEESHANLHEQLAAFFEKYLALKTKAMEQVFLVVKSEESVVYLTKLSNLINDYEKEAAIAEQKRLELVGSIPAGGGLLDLF